MQFYGTPLPGVEQNEEYPGKLIVIEGTDGVGRSTHTALLKTWLESRGHAVLDTGMTLTLSSAAVAGSSSTFNIALRRSAPTLRTEREAFST